MNCKFLILMVLLCLCLLVGGVSASTHYANITADNTSAWAIHITTAAAGSPFYTLRNTASGTAVSTFFDTVIGAGTTTNYLSTFRRQVLEFNMSNASPVMPVDATITSATVCLVGYTAGSTALGSPNYALTRFRPATNGSVIGADYNKFDDDELSNNISQASWVTTGCNYLTLNSFGVSNLSRNGYANYMLRMSFDYLNTTDGYTWKLGSLNKTSNYFRAPSYTIASQRPFINITYTLTDIPPTASYTQNATEGLSPTTIQFNDTSINSPISWNWSFGDGTYSESQNPVKTYSTNGTFTVNFTATNSGGSDFELKNQSVYIYGVTHPRLVNVRQSPGYLNRTIAPWSTAEGRITSSATAGLSHDYSTIGSGTGGYSYNHAKYAYDMALEYQFGGDTNYVNKTVEALLVSWSGYNVTHSGANANFQVGQNRALLYYDYAYDLIWQTHGVNSTLDYSNNTIIQTNLALFANSTYYESTTPIGTDVFWMPEAYTEIAVTQLVLPDYTNTSILSISDGTSNAWSALGYSELFVNSTKQDYDYYPNAGFASFDINTIDGRPYTIGYSEYVKTTVFRWAQIYNNVYGVNLFETFPYIKEMAIEPVKSTFPNHYNSHVGSGSEHLSFPSSLTYNLLDVTNRSNVKWHQDAVDIEYHDHSPFRSATDPYDLDLPKYLYQDDYLYNYNYSTLSAVPPTTLNNIGKDISYQTMRTDWSEQAGWLQFITWNMSWSETTRTPNHQDQLSFEYYSHGDALLPDAGEPNQVDFAPYDTTSFTKDTATHNTFLIDNGYGRGTYSNVTGRGMSKAISNSARPITPSTVSVAANTPTISLIVANVTIDWITDSVTGAADGVDTALTPNVQYSRAVLLPLGGYPIIVDRANSTGSYGYTNEFRLSSMSINSSSYPISSINVLGNVNGTLNINGVNYDWKNGTLGAEYTVGTINAIDWNTTNPYGDPVRLKLFTAPSTPVTYQKFITVTGGNANYRNNVANPQVYFKQSAGNTLYRVTTLLSRYDNETPRTPSELTVTGTGSAIKVISADGTKTDTIYTGTGVSTFNSLTTAADTLFIRGVGQCASDYTLINGNYINHGTSYVYFSSVIMDYVSYNRTGGIHTVNTSSANLALQDFYGVSPSPTYVRVDGVDIAISYDAINDILTVPTDPGEHSIEFDDNAAVNCLIPLQITNLTGVQSSCNSINWSWIDPVDPNYAAIDAYNNNTFYATYLNGTGFVNWTDLPEMLPITFSALARDGSGVPVYNTTWENATVISGACGVAPNASFTYVPHLGTDSIDVQFTDTSVNVPTSWGWFFQNVTGNNTIVQFSTLQNPLHTFEIGNYSIHLNATNMYGSNVTPDINWVNVSPHQTFPPVSAFTSNVTTICPGDYVQFTDMSVNATTWFWLFGSGGVDSHLQNPITNTFDTDGLWDVRLRATNDDGTDWENKTGYITVSNCTKPMGIASCFASFVAINGTYTAEEYNWDFGDGFTGSGISVNHTFQWGRGYTITLSTINESVMTNVTSYYGGCEKQSTAQSSNVGTPLNPMVALSAIVVIAMIVAKRKRGLK